MSRFRRETIGDKVDEAKNTMVELVLNLKDYG